MEISRGTSFQNPSLSLSDFVINKNELYTDNLTKLHVYNLEEKKQSNIEFNNNNIYYTSKIIISKCGNFLLVGLNDGTIYKIDIVSHSVLQTFIGHIKLIRSIVFGDNGAFFSLSDDNSIKKWDIITGQCIKTLNFIPFWTICILYDSPDRLFFSTHDGKIGCLNSENGQEINKISPHAQPIFELYIVNDKWMASGCRWEGTITLWDRKTLTCIKKFTSKYSLLKFNVSSCECFIIAEFTNYPKSIIIKIWNISTSDFNCVSEFEDNYLNYQISTIKIEISLDKKLFYIGRSNGEIQKYTVDIVLKRDKYKLYKLLLSGNIVSENIVSGKIVDYKKQDILFKISAKTSARIDKDVIVLTDHLNNESFHIFIPNECNHNQWSCDYNQLSCNQWSCDKLSCNQWVECINIISFQLALPLDERYNYLFAQKIIDNYRFDVFQTIFFFYSQSGSGKFLLSRNNLYFIKIYL